MRKLIRRVINRLKYMKAIRSSSNYVKYLRDRGISVGEDCFFQSPKTATIDPTRPLLVDIGNHCYFLENFTLLTHDNITKVFGPLYNEYIPSTIKRTAKNKAATIFIQFLMTVNCHRKVNSLSFPDFG